MWFFGVAEFAMKFLIIGIIPALRADVMGAVIALLVVNGYFALLLVLGPYAKKTDNFLAVCLNAMLCIVVLVSALLKLDVAYLSNNAASGFEKETAAQLLVVSNVLVILLTCGCYAISVWRSEHGDDKQGADAESEVQLLQSTSGSRSDYSSLQEPLLTQEAA